MKIAHVLGSLGMGGAERVALDLGYEQMRAGHEVVAISLAPSEGGPMADAFLQAKIAVHHVPKRPGLDWTLPARSARCLRSLGVQVAHTHNTRPLAYAAAAARLAGMTVVHTKHGEGHLVSRAGQILRRTGAPFVHRFVSVSEATAEHARRQKAYPFASRMHVIENGIRMDVHRPDAEARLEIRSELGIPNDAWLVGTVGRVDENKNQASLLRAMAPSLGPEQQVVIVGDGESMDKLASQVESMAGGKYVHLLGRRGDAHRVMAALDVFALTSKSEGLPLVILEAMATGASIVSTDVGGIADVVEEGRSGLLVPPADDAALTDALGRLAGDRQLADQLARVAREQVGDRYSSETMANKYMELYAIENARRS